ncbi:hypothetical protein C7N43_05680 [Sphingobacteriales bacterium UPWRP_1]|nr:hypothetical protein BVG80_06550 [Sphingobacteriales bacterium TSM_CSM]PSJ78068.1 hypothetical protein C7N43_05680 [Sphingobacteriales bacterium UPWRP_1]
MRNPKVRLIVFTLFAFVAVFLSSCRRGEDDPWFSFTTRTTRITANWRLDIYSLDYVDKLETTITFNTTACDTGNIGGTNISNVIQQEELQDSILNSITNYVDGTNTVTRIYDVNFAYFLNIRDNGTYLVNGTFSYFNPQLNAQVTGDFSSDENTWYWENSDQTKWALTFVNFPLIDGSNIESNNLPVRYIPKQTFDLREVRKDALQFEYQTLEENMVNSVFNPYTLYLPNDTVSNCQRTVTASSRLDVYTRWQFKLAE